MPEKTSIAANKVASNAGNQATIPTGAQIESYKRARVKVKHIQPKKKGHGRRICRKITCFSQESDDFVNVMPAGEGFTDALNYMALVRVAGRKVDLSLGTSQYKLPFG